MKKIIGELLNAEFFELDSATGHNFNFPRYEVTPKEYLQFADEEINASINCTKNKINALGHLKRALDEQIDIFFELMGLKIILKRNLKFEKKAKLLFDLGILSIKSLTKLNRIRNKVEHQYIIPTLEDIDVYYEIVWFTIEHIEMYLLLFNGNKDVSFVYYPTNNKADGIYLTIKNTFTGESGISIKRDWEGVTKQFTWKNEEDYEYYVLAFQLYIASIKLFHQVYSDKQFKECLRNLINV